MSRRLSLSDPPTNRKEGHPLIHLTPPTPDDPTYNFHPAPVGEALRELVHDTSDSAVWLLSGDDGVGRRYVLQAAVAGLPEGENSPPRLLHVDLEAFDEVTPFAYFVETLVKARTAAGLPVQRATLEAIRTLGTLASRSLADAAVVEILLQLDDATAPLVEAFLAAAQASPDKQTGQKRLLDLLHRLAQQRPLVLHLVQASMLHRVFRHAVCRAAEEISGLKVALSCHPSDSEPRLVPVDDLRHGVQRIELRPLTAAELHSVLDRRFPGHQLPAPFVVALERHSFGLPGMAAALLEGWIAEGNLVIDDQDRLTALKDLPWLAEGDVREMYMEPILQLIDRPEITMLNGAWMRRFLGLAALCGRFVPAHQLLDSLEVPQELKDEILDLVDDQLGEGDLHLFDDHFVSHPAFPGIPTVEWVAPQARRVFLHGVPAAERSTAAKDLLRILRGTVPMGSRQAAHLFQQLARYLDDPAERAQLRIEDYGWDLDWWVDRQSCDDLRDALIEDLRTDRLPAETLWSVATTHQQWPATRRLALLEAYETAVEAADEEAAAAPGDGRQQVPAERLGSLLYLKARFAFELGRHSEALGLAQEAQKYAGEVVSLELSARTLQHLIESRLGNDGAAQQGLAAVRRDAISSLGATHDITLSATSYLATALRANGQPEAAKPLHAEVLATRQQQLGDGHPETLTALHNLAGCLTDLGETAAAKELFGRSVEIGQQVLGPTHPGTLISMQSLAATQARLGEVAEARTLYEETLEAQRRVLGDAHPFTLTLMDELCRLLDDTTTMPGHRERLRDLRHELLTSIQRLPPAVPLRQHVEARWLPTAGRAVD